MFTVMSDSLTCCKVLANGGFHHIDKWHLDFLQLLLHLRFKKRKRKMGNGKLV